jgi:MoaA/NifB/PqqE/SkfB family radical SAM enzyme
MAPWIQLHAQTNGKMAPCCMSSVHDGNEIGDLRKNADLTHAWNSPGMRQLRLNMLEGKESSLCSNCYEYERLGRHSERMQYNKDFRQHYSRVVSTSKDGGLKNTSIPIIDIRFSNKCNYKCRICESSYSSLLYEEESHIGKPRAADSKEMKATADDAKFWNSYRSLLPEVRRLHFAGGEPLIMEEHYRTLDHLVSIGNTDVHLTYNTNFSTLRYKEYNVLNFWKKFRQVHVWASLDGMGEKGDYQRKGQRWKKIEENIIELQQECPNVFFGINVTVSIFNIMHIPEFYQHMVEHKFVLPDRMNLYILFYPHYFKITCLPSSLKEKAVKQFETLDRQFLSHLPDSSKFKNHIDAVITFMLSENENRLNEFRHWINSVDAVRRENFLPTPG